MKNPFIPTGVVAMGFGLLTVHDAQAFSLAQKDPESETETPAQAENTTLARPLARPDINPYDRDVEITAPLQFNKRILGELPVLLTSDDQFHVSSAEFVALIGPLLTPESLQELTGLLAGRERFLPEIIAPSGILLEYDPQQLALLVLKIAPEKRSVEALYQQSFPEKPGVPPLPFSAYLNASTVISRQSQFGDINKPDFYMNGAVRINNFVLEADAQLRRDFATDNYSFERRYARVVYDQPDQYRRWFAGDLDPETRGRQGFIRMGGLGVVRQKQRFDSFRRNVFSGGRNLVLREQSVVRVSRNGIFQREFTLDAGQYDITNLPLDTGSNDIQIDVEGISGSRQTYEYEAFLDTIELAPGDYEYGAYLGFLDEGGFANPDYASRELVFSGFWRKAFLNRPAIGIGVQLSEDVQNVTTQTQFLLGRDGRIRLDVGGSNAPPGMGFAATIGYDQIIGNRSGIGYDTVSVVADYTSKDYSTIGRIPGVNPISWNLTAAHTKRVTPKLFVTSNLSYRKSRSPQLRDSYSITSTANYRFNPEWSAQVGVEYIRNGFIGTQSRNNGFGISVGLIWQPKYNRRAEARYNTLRNMGSSRYQKSTSNRAGSYGYSVNSSYNDGRSSLGGQFDYVGNRFEANLTHTAYGSQIRSIGDEQVTSFRLGTSIAVAGGHVAMGRTINDSFALVYPHETLKNRSVIVGDSLEGGKYTSRSGTFGPAVQNNLSAFLNQSVRYDVMDPPIGYDIGDGVERVRPAYKSGYAIEVGSAAFVSAIGTLTTSSGKPVKLVSGLLRRLDDPDKLPEPFFTNSVGRFAISKLEPGVEYVVELQFEGPKKFIFKVPEDTEGLVELSTAQIEAK
ncbi:MAG: hypothetical protein ACK5NN_01080 [Sphingomonadaceae bacterium]